MWIAPECHEAQMTARQDAAPRGAVGDPPLEFTRRDAVKIAAVAGGGLALAAVGAAASRLGAPDPIPTGAETVRAVPETPTVPKGEGADPLVRMQEELRRALAKPVEQRRWRMVIDTRKCVGCHACTVACIAENRLPPGVVYRPVLQTEIGTFPNLALRFTPRPCMQCENPPCVPVCPVEATRKRPDGITAIDYDRCIGCGYCVTACPYNARTRDLGERYSDRTPAVQPYDEGHNHEYLKAWRRDEGDSPVGNVRKCHFCLHRLEQGLLPQCVTTCIGRANYFGDANDPDALVNEQAASPSAVRLLEHRGTRPSVVYLV
jgi:molybdopterin-containing oxidoreductase family iron-sulfur binding subunit